MIDLKRRQELFDQGYWEIPEGLDTSNFDFTWRPEPYDRPYIHQFGTQWQKTGGPRFVIPENEGIKYQSHQHAIRLPRPEDRGFRPLRPNVQFDYSWHPDSNDPPYIYVFGNQWYDVDTMPTIQYRVKGATEKKYIYDVTATLLPNKEKFELLIDDIVEFDYSWVPHPHEPPMSFVFGNQLYDSKTMPTIKYLGGELIKYVDDIQAIIKPNPRKFRQIQPIDAFDYSWRPNPNDPPYNYVFGNEYHSVEFMPTVMYRVKGAKETKYITDEKASLSIEKVQYEDTIFDAVVNHEFKTKYVHFQNSKHPVDYKMIIPKYDPEREYAHLFEDFAIIPDTIKSHLVSKLSDYPYIHTDKSCGYRALLDIIFFSNGESCAEENYQSLLDLNLPNRIVHVKDVNGRVASQHAAANASNTPWYFLINAKLKVNPEFDFTWQPDIMQSRRHYIFKALNPVNGLEYGHMATVANNKKLTLSTVGYGLDFTMDSPTEVVDINCGTAIYNSSEWDTWRTAFREVIKLCYAKDSESKKRLEIWTTVADGAFAQNSLQGALDAVEYYESVNGEFEKLKLSYDWAWLKERYNK